MRRTLVITAALAGCNDHTHDRPRSYDERIEERRAEATLAADGEVFVEHADATAIAVGGDMLVWIEATSTSSQTLKARRLAGGEPFTILTAADQMLTELAVSGERAAFEINPLVASGSGGVAEVALAPGATARVLDRAASRIAIDGASTYIATKTGVFALPGRTQLAALDALVWNLVAREGSVAWLATPLPVGVDRDYLAKPIGTIETIKTGGGGKVIELGPANIAVDGFRARGSIDAPHIT